MGSTGRVFRGLLTDGVRRAQRIEELAFCVESEYLDAHAPGWREGEATVRAVKRAQRASLKPRPAWTLELAC